MSAMTPLPVVRKAATASTQHMVHMSHVAWGIAAGTCTSGTGCCVTDLPSETGIP